MGTGRQRMADMASVMTELLARSEYSPLLRIDMRDGIFADTQGDLQAIRRVLDKRPSRRVRKGSSALGPTIKRAKVKAARKANVRRLAK